MSFFIPSCTKHFLSDILQAQDDNVGDVGDDDDDDDDDDDGVVDVDVVLGTKRSQQNKLCFSTRNVQSSSADTRERRR